MDRVRTLARHDDAVVTPVKQPAGVGNCMNREPKHVSIESGRNLQVWHRDDESGFADTCHQSFPARADRIRTGRILPNPPQLLRSRKTAPSRKPRTPAMAYRSIRATSLPQT